MPTVHLYPRTQRFGEHEKPVTWELGYRCEQNLSTRHLIGVFLDSFPGFLERIPCPDFALEMAGNQFLGAPPKLKDLKQILIRIEPGSQPETSYALALKDDLVDAGLWRLVGKTAVNRYGAVFRQCFEQLPRHRSRNRIKGKVGVILMAGIMELSIKIHIAAIQDNSCTLSV